MSENTKRVIKDWLSFMFGVLFVLCLVASAFASGRAKVDSNGKPVTIFAPDTFAAYSATKGTKSHTTTGLIGIKVRTTAAGTTLKLNGSGVGVPITENVWEEYGVGEGVSSAVFTLPSSATRTKVYVQSY